MMYLIVLSLITIGACMDYSDYIARNISLPLSAALYSSEPSSCLQKKLDSAIVTEYSVSWGGGFCSGLIVSLPESNAIALVFRAEIAEPSKFVAKWFELFVPFTTWRHSGKVSKFLEKGFSKLWLKGGMRKDFEKIMKQRGSDDVLVTGYSLGGGVAALVAVDIVKDGLADKDKVTLTTLGQPMVGDKDFAKEYEQQVM
ncbi:triacylglycerol lipase [Ancylostoma duodenale]|uniref:Triacylglycerol lipase n=1 Tax=Ancylostoma duodenale TaxID=51022 RepID=A0A0C2CUK2_9BILA|nr:triacylglycerol lipase [Ancylostoma duodenale]